MKGKIRTDGQLCLERRGKLERQACPYVTDSPCGDWCPHFGEPNTTVTTATGGYQDTRTSLDLTCGGQPVRFYFDEFTDERLTKGENDEST